MPLFLLFFLWRKKNHKNGFKNKVMGKLWFLTFLKICIRVAVWEAESHAVLFRVHVSTTNRCWPVYKLGTARAKKWSFLRLARDKEPSQSLDFPNTVEPVDAIELRSFLFVIQKSETLIVLFLQISLDFGNNSIIVPNS